MKIPIHSLLNAIENALKSKMPFTAYRFPDSKEIKGLFQQNDTLYHRVNFNDQGFVFAPFDDQGPTILFPLSHSKTLSTTDALIFKEPIVKGHTEIPVENGKDKHLNLVQKGIDFLKATDAKKVVLSRKEMINHTNFSAVETFMRLLINYPEAMVYVWFHPEVGLWLGASPETLLSTEQEDFTTMALAGTQVYQGSLEVIWQNKEKDEQQYVTDYILKKLSTVAGNIITSDPQTVKAGSLVHLCTTIKGRISGQLSLDKLLTELHPTPAVCGLPQQEAKQFILANENYNRDYYTGFLGEININNTSSLFVNLRCMQAFTSNLALYIGGGITVDSIPENEWEETVAKSKVMLKVLL